MDKVHAEPLSDSQERHLTHKVKFHDFPPQEKSGLRLLPNTLSGHVRMTPYFVLPLLQHIRESADKHQHATSWTSTSSRNRTATSCLTVSHAEHKASLPVSISDHGRWPRAEEEGAGSTGTAEGWQAWGGQDTEGACPVPHP